MNSEKLKYLNDLERLINRLDDTLGGIRHLRPYSPKKFELHHFRYFNIKREEGERDEYRTTNLGFYDAFSLYLNLDAWNVLLETIEKQKEAAQREFNDLIGEAREDE